MANFKAFNLSSKMITSLTRQGYLTPSKVQELVIPKALKGQNLVIRSETGSGKTHAYLIPVLSQIERLNASFLNTVIVAPTNELARQIFIFTRGFKKEYPEIKVRLLTSETSEKENITGLKEVPNIIIGTPGRLSKLFQKGYLRKEYVETIVLDEADMLLELGYFNEIDYMMRLFNKPQVLIFSATINESLNDKIIKYIGADYEISGGASKTSSHVYHHLINIHHQDINHTVSDFIKNKNPYFLLIFASNKNEVKNIYNYLKEKKYSVIMITGDLSERERKAAIKRINNDEFQIVVASDLLSRGMDFKNISDVLSVNLPSDLTYYYHRAGRTGRFDQIGHSYVFYNPNDTKRIEALMKQGIIFDYFSLKNGILVETKEFKKTFNKKKKIDNELLRDIKKAKYETKGHKVKPNYKKKVKVAIEKVKRKHKRELIRKDIRRQRVARYIQEAKKNNYE